MLRLIFVLCLLFTMTSACSNNSNEAALGGSEPSNSIVYGLTLSPSGFDPHVNQSSEIGIVLRQVYDTLVYRNPNTGQFVPGLATNWTISNDLLTYEFNLRENVFFHDGTEFNASAVAANLDRITNPNTRSQHAVFLLGSYDRYEIVDDYTIRIHLTEPYSPLLDSLSQVYLGIASPTALEEFSTERYQFNQVGTGPFKFVEYIPDTRIALTRNDAYAWSPEFYQAPQNGIRDIEFRFFVNPAARLLALENRDVEIVGELLPLDARSLTGNNQFQLVPVPIGGQPDQFLINSSRFPTDNVVIRRALIYGANRQLIADRIYQGFSPVATGPLARNTQYYSALTADLYAYDPQQARALISSLGYVDDDNNGFYDVEEGDLTIVVLVPPWGEYREITEILQSQWESIGIRVDTVLIPDFPSLLSAVSDGNYNLVAFNSYGLDPAFLNSYYTTNGNRNFSNVTNPELDNILFEAQRQLDPTIRRQLYESAQNLIMQEALLIPLRDRVNLNGHHATIENLNYDAYGWFPLLHNVNTIETQQ